MKEVLRVNGDRLWSRLMQMAAIGATPRGGCNRQALTDADMAGRKLLSQWAEAAGCSARVDAVGNIFIRRDGTDESLPVVMTGSHLDTQPTGGKFDGVYGVLAGLEVIESLNDAGLATRHPIELAAWCRAGGCRFGMSLVWRAGGRLFCGRRVSLGALRDAERARISRRQQRTGLGIAPDAAVSRQPIKA